MMRTIRISEEVWNEIAKRGKFGETEEEVLRRVFGLSEAEKIVSNKNLFRELRGEDMKEYSGRSFIRSPRKAKLVLSSRVTGGKLAVEFPEIRKSQEWELPVKSNKEGIRRVLEEALYFGEKHGATDGQLKAIRKALTENGYHLVGPRRIEGLI
jgi:hypothetical protein